MASVTDDRKNDEKPMATNELAGGGADEPREAARSVGKPAGDQGFFSIYKKGQGYWTRMGTAFGAVLVGALTAHFLYQQLPAWGVPSNVTVGISAGFLIAYGLLVFWLMNKPTNADFLIATDSEMKKVNWTSRKELIGSTKVVIIFMLLIATFLFVVDQVFALLFWAIDVLKVPPFFISG